MVMHALAYIAEERLQEAIARGEFDNLPGAGKPLRLIDLGSRDRCDRVTFHIFRNSGFLPPTLAIRKEFEEALESGYALLRRSEEQLQAVQSGLRRQLPAEPEQALKVLRAIGVADSPAVRRLCRERIGKQQPACARALVQKIRLFNALRRRLLDRLQEQLQHLDALATRAEEMKIQDELMHKRRLDLPPLSCADLRMQIERAWHQRFVEIVLQDENGH